MRCRWCLAVALLVLLAMPAAAGAQQSTVEYFGYFAARITPAGGDHLAEVADRSNLNWVQISDVDRYRPEVLDGCRPRGCIVSTGHEFFTGCDGQGSPSCNLYPDYRERWQRLADAVRSRIDKVGAFYLLDEPQFRGASPEELATAAAAIKATYPSVPVMMVEAGPAVTESLRVPAGIDWVGFDWYCRRFTDIEAKLAILEHQTAAAQRLFLMPEAAPLTECGGAPGHATDAEIAALQMRYLQLAEAHPRVIGLLAFGFWTSGYDSADLPRTVAAHRAIAARVIRPPAPPAPPPPPAPAPQVVKRAAVVKRGIRIDRRGRVTVPLRCSRAATVACTGRLALAARGRVLARKRFSVAPGTSTRLRVRTRRPAIVRRARRRAGVPARLMLRTPAGGATLKVRLRRR
jgi:hypothetical protein